MRDYIEVVNTRPSAAPSKQLDQWSHLGKFPKTTLGIAVAKRIGIPHFVHGRWRQTGFDGFMPTEYFSLRFSERFKGTQKQ